MSTPFDEITKEYVKALQEANRLHAEVMQSDDKNLEAEWLANKTRVEELHARWLKGFHTSRSAS